MHSSSVTCPLDTVSAMFSILMVVSGVISPVPLVADPRCSQRCSCHVARNAVNAFCVIDKPRTNLSELPGDLNDLIIHCGPTASPDNSPSIDRYSLLHLPKLTSLKFEDCSLNLISSDIFSDRTRLSSFIMQRVGTVNLTANFTSATLKHIKTLVISYTYARFDNPNAICAYNSLEMIVISNVPSNDIAMKLFSCTRPFINTSTLDLSHNGMTTLPRNLSKLFPNVRYLTIRGNNITILPIIHPLKSLTQLDISSNRIKILPRIAFGNNITVFNVSRNELLAKQSFIAVFIRLKKLEILDMSYNTLYNRIWTSVGFCRKIQIVKLRNVSMDKLSLSVLSRVTTLQYLDLGENKVRIVYARTFQKLSNLNTLLLDYNPINNTNELSFFGLKSLKYLDLKHNNLIRIDASAFKSSSYTLEYIDMSHNFLETMYPGIFLKNLVTAYLGNNRIKRIVVKSTKLKLLSLEHNEVWNLDRSQFSTCQNTLEQLDLSHNKLISIGLTFNLLSAIRKIDLRSNNIATVLPSQLITKNANKTYYFLSDNPTKCPCDTWLQTYRYIPRSFYIGDYSNMKCTSGYTFKTVDRHERHSQRPFCNYSGRTLCREYCTCCHLPTCSCRYECPDGCKCLYSLSQRYHTIICINTGFTDCPRGIETVHITELDLTANNFQDITNQTFNGYANLKTLKLSKNKISHISNSSFKDLAALESLHLDNNRISILNSSVFHGLLNLRHLYLKNNIIRHINENSFKPILNLISLDVSNNLLTDINSLSISGISNSVSDIDVTGNAFVCPCDEVSKTQLTITLFSNHIPNLFNLTCEIERKLRNSSSFQEKVVISDFLLKHSEMCKNVSFIGDRPPRVGEVGEKTDLTQYIYVALFLLIVIIVIILVYEYQTMILLFVFVRCGVRIFTKKMDKNKLYDAFISYSNVDQEYVVNHLAPGLESAQYSLCIHYRDFPVGANIADSIVSAVENSRCTIMVLSDNFLKSEWCKLEFQAAHYQVLKSRSNRLVIVLLEDVDVKNLDKSLKSYMKTNVYLRADDPWFWKKIEYAIPRRRLGELVDPELTNYQNRN